MSQAKGWRRSAAAIAHAAMAALLGAAIIALPPAKADAAAAAGLRTDYVVSGQGMVWLEQDEHGVKQVHYRNLGTGVERTITDSATAKDAPGINGNEIVWADKGDQAPSSAYWDIYGYNVQTGRTEKLNVQTGEWANPTTDGVGVIWYDQNPVGQMHYRYLATGQEYSLGEGLFPALADGRIVYRNARDGGLTMLDLRSGVRTPLLVLGGANSADWFAFNGEYVVWKQVNEDGESKYVSLSVRDPAAQPQDLTAFSRKSVEYSFLSISDSAAAFVIEENGQPTLKSVDLSNAKVYSLGSAADIGSLLGLSGNKLMVGGEGGSVTSIDAIPGSTGSGGGTAPSGGSGGSVAAGEKATAVIGAQGGRLESSDGRARIDFEADTFASDTEVQLAAEDLGNYALQDEKGRTLEAAEAWRFSSASALAKKAKLRLGYDAGAAWQGRTEKLGIFKYDETAGRWLYQGGVTQAEAGFVSADIAGPGVYAVMLRQVGFADLSGHWAKNAVETLAARGIVDGTGAGRYEPAGILTRAQFAKLLVAALRVDAPASGAASFTDVSSSAWYADPIRAAVAAGLAQGDGSRFRPNDSLTREQMMAMLVRAYESVNGTTEAGDSLSAYADSTSVSAWAKETTAKAVALKLIEGNGGKLNPQGTTTRAEAATVIYRLLGQIGRL